MRRLVPLFVATSLAGCAVAPPPAVPDLRAQAQLAQLLAGKVAGAPQRCLPRFQSSQLVATGPNTLAYRDGGTIYVTHTQGSCAGLQMGYTLVTKPFGFSSGPCSGDVGRVIDPSSGMMVGSCFFGDFVPYRAIR